MKSTEFDSNYHSDGKVIPMTNDTEEEIPEGVLFEIAKAEFYKTLKWLWLKPILYFLLLQGGVLLSLIIVGVIARYIGIIIQISLPTIDIGIPSLDIDRVSIALFQSAISVSGIMVGSL